MKRVWLAVTSAVTVVFVVYGTHVRGALTDLKVYRTGGAAWIHNTPLYTSKFPFWLPFTYPPVAAVLFSVLAILPMMVAADCLLARTRYPRGVLVGIAAAVKLTPAVFILFFLARRQRGPAVTAAVTFVCASGLGMLVAPADSLRYWHTTIFDPDRIGGAEFVTNQSLRGALTRLDLPRSSTELLWLALSATVLVVAWFAARRVQDPVTALLVVAAAGLVVSPVSWSHHWVWIVPALFVGVTRLYRNPPALAALAATAVVFLAGQRYLPHGNDLELQWTWWQHVLGNSYLLVALGFLVWTAAAHRKPATVSQPAVAT